MIWWYVNALAICIVVGVGILWAAHRIVED